eukprot:g28539.t1
MVVLAESCGWRCESRRWRESPRRRPLQFEGKKEQARARARAKGFSFMFFSEFKILRSSESCPSLLKPAKPTKLAREDEPEVISLYDNRLQKCTSNVTFHDIPELYYFEAEAESPLHPRRSQRSDDEIYRRMSLIAENHERIMSQWTSCYAGLARLWHGPSSGENVQ